ncbi:hypothetical protein MJO28_007275 [Puccinia striiformis f. sp. tritici]|uniref:Uncharacterized protein n=1 Tax=Puccinia striiformis f. sp. tritici TaxID=168172 RepID=A0ACC0EE38_9BASI|nr:hypothetical protein MJO28_007275 [Puccinia striiformis f. sp. tritici]
MELSFSLQSRSFSGSGQLTGGFVDGNIGVPGRSAEALSASRATETGRSRHIPSTLTPVGVGATH